MEASGLVETPFVRSVEIRLVSDPAERRQANSVNARPIARECACTHTTTRRVAQPVVRDLSDGDGPTTPRRRDLVTRIARTTMSDLEVSPIDSVMPLAMAVERAQVEAAPTRLLGWI